MKTILISLLLALSSCTVEIVISKQETVQEKLELFP